VSLSRNFGKEAVLDGGLRYARRCASFCSWMRRPASADPCSRGWSFTGSMTATTSVYTAKMAHREMNRCPVPPAPPCGAWLLRAIIGGARHKSRSMPATSACLSPRASAARLQLPAQCFFKDFQAGSRASRQIPVSSMNLAPRAHGRHTFSQGGPAGRPSIEGLTIFSVSGLPRRFEPALGSALAFPSRRVVPVRPSLRWET